MSGKVGRWVGNTWPSGESPVADAVALSQRIQNGPNIDTAFFIFS